MSKIEQKVEDQLDQEYMDNYGFVYCPCCGIHLENGISIHDPDEVEFGTGKRIYMNNKYLYACLGCGEEFGPELEPEKVPKKTGKKHPKNMELRAKCFEVFRNGEGAKYCEQEFGITYGNAHYYLRAFRKEMAKQDK
jgi:hypothetical protein